MTITKKTVADKIAAYLHHEISLAQLVDWSLLVAEIVITINADDAAANQLADDIDALLRRTISSVRRASSGASTGARMRRAAAGSGIL